MRCIRSKGVRCFGQDLLAKISKKNNDVDKMIQPLDFPCKDRLCLSNLIGTAYKTVERFV